MITHHLFCTILWVFYLFSFLTGACFSMCLQNVFSKCFYNTGCPSTAMLRQLWHGVQVSQNGLQPTL